MINLGDKINPKKNAIIFQIQRFSIEDGPGIRTTVFFKECPLRCKWCHNPESIFKKSQLEWYINKCINCKICIETCKQKALLFDKDGLHINRDKCISCGECENICPSTALHMLGKWWNLEHLFIEIQKDKAYYIQSKGGITVSGGEPTTQPDILFSFLKKCKNDGISTALDTCGYAPKEIYEKILPFVDLILLDIKEIDSKKHEEFTGVPNNTILENAIWLSKYVKKNNKIIWIRTPIIPHYTATEENITGIGEFITEKLDNIPERWDLLAFNHLCIEKYSRLGIEWILKDEPILTDEDMEVFLKLAKNSGVKNIQWSGLTSKKKSKEN